MISSILIGLAQVVGVVLDLATYLILGSAVISWVNADPYNPIVRTINGLTEPMYRPFRRFTQNFSGPIDLAPMIVILIIIFLRASLPRYLMILAANFS